MRWVQVRFEWIPLGKPTAEVEIIKGTCDSCSDSCERYVGSSSSLVYAIGPNGVDRADDRQIAIRSGIN